MPSRSRERNSRRRRSSQTAKAHWPLKSLDAGVAPLLVGVQDDFGVGPGREPVALVGQLVAQFDVVEDFAVEGDPEPGLGVAHRLVAAGQIDDAQPRMAQRDGTVDVDALFVRPAVRDRGQHSA